jgi:hypothetical protein
MSDWWARRLGGSNPPAPTTPMPQPQPGQWYPPTTAPVPQVPQGPPQVTVANLMEAVSAWSGGEGQRNSARCPGCGGTNLFRRQVGAVEAAPLCYDCGWNGLWTQVQPRT